MQGIDDINNILIDINEVPSDSEHDASVSTAAIYARTS